VELGAGEVYGYKRDYETQGDRAAGVTLEVGAGFDQRHAIHV
jgi:hypothetical protein